MHTLGHSLAASGKDGVKFESIDDVNRDFGSTWRRYGQVRNIPIFEARLLKVAQSKLANILFAKEISRRYQDEQIYSSATHPGVVKTGAYPPSFTCKSVYLYYLQSCLEDLHKRTPT